MSGAVLYGERAGHKGGGGVKWGAWLVRGGVLGLQKWRYA
jgi:hypothetical protein